MATGPTGGAPAVLAEVIAHAWSQSEDLFRQTEDLADEAQQILTDIAAHSIAPGQITGTHAFTPTAIPSEVPQGGIVAVDSSYQMPGGQAITVQPVALDTSYLPPVRPSLQVDDPNAGYLMYDSTRQQIEGMLTGAFYDFLTDFFPSGYFDAALGWLNRAITQGGTGVNADVERALWERDRARFVGEQTRAEMEVTTQSANRRWPLPPGVMLAQHQAIALDTRNKLADQSRTIAIESWKVELENTRFAVGQVIDLRIKSIAAAGDYIRTLILGPQTAMQLATSLADMRTKFNQSLVALYSAESAALEPRVRLNIADADLRMRGEEANQRSGMDLRRLYKEAVDARSRLQVDRAGLEVNQEQANARMRLDSIIQRLQVLQGDNRLRVEVQEGKNRIAAQQADLTQRAGEANQRTALGVGQAKAEVVMRVAQMMGTAASAALNGVNAGVSIQGNDTSSV